MNPDRLQRRLIAREGNPLVFHDAMTGAVPMVLQHGLCGFAGQAVDACPDDPAIRLLTLECRGHGASPAGPPMGLSIATFADDVIAMIETAVGAPVILGGISMGAAISLRIAVRRPDLVRALVLIRPAWTVASAPANLRSLAEVGALLRAHPGGDARAIFDASATARELAATSPDNLESLRGFFSREPIAVTAELLSRIPQDGPGLTAEDLRGIAVPALVIGTAADTIHPMAMASELARTLPRGSFAEITPKSVSLSRYLADMHAVIAAFLPHTATGDARGT